MSTKDDGGFAFPRTYSGAGNEPQRGMSLRDWFAGQYITGNQWLGTPEDHALDAYRMADAMLAERSKP